MDTIGVNNAEELYDEGNMLIECKDYSGAMGCYLRAAEQGHAGAQHQLALCYTLGTGVDKNDDEAFKWFKAAADQGHADATCNLGLCYMRGTGVAVDENEGLRLINKAAEMGSVFAKEHLAIINDEADKPSKKGGVGYILLRIIAFPFWIAWEFIKALLSLFHIAVGDDAAVRGFKRGYNGDGDDFEEYTFTNDMGCTQTVYSKNGREFYDANGSYVGSSDDGGKTIHS